MTAAISDEERRSLRATFDLFDESNTGTVTTSKLGVVLRACGEAPTEAWLSEAARRADADGGTVSFEAFVRLVQEGRAAEKRLDAAAVEAAFAVFDTGKKGVIHQDEIKRILTTLGEKLTEEEVEELLGEDVEGDGMVRYAELAKRICP